MTALSEETGPLELATRAMLDGDRAYVAKSWVSSYERLARIPPTVYAEHYPAVVAACLEGAQTVVLVVARTPTLVVGFACGAPHDGVLHYVYVRAEARGGGLGTRLVRALFADRPLPARVHCTARLPWPSKRFVFNPFKLGVVL
jgi:GNAT superfamily N-acetyltransferase